jgi:sporulation protein YtfJ
MTHPINDVMTTSLSNIKEMVDVDKIIGNPMKLDDGSLVVPVCKVGFGFGSGGSEFSSNKSSETPPPFGGGSVAGVSLSPVAFLVVKDNKVDLLHMNSQTHIFEKIIDVVEKTVNKQ